MEDNTIGKDNHVMEDGDKVPCDDYRPDKARQYRCGFDNGVCPFKGDESKCGGKD